MSHNVNVIPANVENSVVSQPVNQVEREKETYSAEVNTVEELNAITVARKEEAAEKENQRQKIGEIPSMNMLSVEEPTFDPEKNQ